MWTLESDDEITPSRIVKIRGIDFQDARSALQQIFAKFVRGIADGRALQGAGSASEPLIARRRNIGVTPNQAGSCLWW